MLVSDCHMDVVGCFWDTLRETNRAPNKTGRWGLKVRLTYLCFCIAADMPTLCQSECYIHYTCLVCRYDLNVSMVGWEWKLVKSDVFLLRKSWAPKRKSPLRWGAFSSSMFVFQGCTPWKMNGRNLRIRAPRKMKIIFQEPSWLQVPAVNLPLGCPRKLGSMVSRWVITPRG